jgi:DNA-binding MarR family transcriptional regulator
MESHCRGQFSNQLCAVKDATAGPYEAMDEELISVQRHPSHEVVSPRHFRKNDLREKRSCTGNLVMDARDLARNQRFSPGVEEAGRNGAMIRWHELISLFQRDLDPTSCRVYTRNMKIDNCLCTGIRQAAHAMTEIYDQALAPSGLKITMFRVLRRLSNAGLPTITELAEIVELERSSLSRNLKVLERDGFVCFGGSYDERGKVVQLTPAGKAALKKALPLWLEAQARMKLEIGGEHDSIFAILSKLNDAKAAPSPAGRSSSLSAK